MVQVFEPYNVNTELLRETMFVHVTSNKEVAEQELGALIWDKPKLESAYKSALEPYGYREQRPGMQRVFRIYECEVFNYLNEGLKGLIPNQPTAKEDQ